MSRACAEATSRASIAGAAAGSTGGCDTSRRCAGAANHPGPGSSDGTVPELCLAGNDPLGRFGDHPEDKLRLSSDDTLNRGRAGALDVAVAHRCESPRTCT